MERPGESHPIAMQPPPARDARATPPRRRGVLARVSAWRDGDSSEALIALVVLGGLIELFLLILLSRFPLSKWFPSAPTSLGFPQQMSGNWSADARWLTLVLAAPFVAYVPALLYVRSLRGRLAAGIVAVWAVIFGVTLLNLYPITAADVFHYLADARTLWVYHADPMLTPPEAHPFVIAISWMQQPSPYGPLWQLISVIPVAIASNHWLLSLLGFKAIGLFSVLACAALIYAIVRRTLPGRQNFALLLFLWNPFVIFRAVGNGHNDLTMMAFALAAFYCVLLRRWRWALPLLALSISIKYSTALIVPPVLLYGWCASGRQGRRELVLGAAIGVLTAIVVFAPFWRGFDTFKTFVQNTNLHISSLPEWFAIWLQPRYTQTQAETIAKDAGYLLFAVAYLGMLYRLWRRPSFARLIAVCALTFIAYLALCTWWFRPWYFLWFIPLGALLADGWWPWLIAGTTFSCTFFDIIEQYRSHSTWLMATDFRAYGGPVFFAFVPLLLLLLLGLTVYRSWTLAPAQPACNDAQVAP